VHGAHRLAFIRGPESSSESAARYEGFLDALGSRGISVSERAVVPGGLSREDGVNGVELLYAHRGGRALSLDAIVCVNDEVALGVLEELHRRNLGVPKPIAVTGFDDEPGAQTCNPPLTTVRQSARAQGEAAAQILCEHLIQGQPLTDQVLDAELILRDSCGCRSPFQNDSRKLDPERARVARTARLALIERRATMVARLAHAGGGRMVGVHDWEGRLIDSLAAQVDSEDGGAFLWEFERMARTHVLHGGDPMVCHDVLSTLRLQALVSVEVEPGLRPQVEDLFQEARLLLSRVALAVGREHADNVQVRMRLLRRAGLSLLSDRNLEPFLLALEEHLPLLGVSSWCISRLPENVGGEEVRPVVAGRVAGLRGEAVETVGVRSLGLDEGLSRLSSVVVLPLVFGGEPVVIATFAWGALEPRIYEELRELLALTLYATRDEASPLSRRA